MEINKCSSLPPSLHLSLSPPPSLQTQKGREKVGCRTGERPNRDPMKRQRMGKDGEEGGGKNSVQTHGSVSLKVALRKILRHIM